jgi:hypothetical protein
LGKKEAESEGRCVKMERKKLRKEGGEGNVSEGESVILETNI